MEHLFREANLNLEELIGLQRRALVKAKMIGGYLNRAQKVVEIELCEKWLDYLGQYFKGSERNAQNYMEIARRWHELEAEVARNPELSIDGALRILRRQNVMQKLTKTWSDEEKEWLRQDPDAFPTAVSELRTKLRHKHEGLNYSERDAIPYATDRLRWKLEIQREVLKQFEPGWSITDELCPSDYTEVSKKFSDPAWSITDELCPADFTDSSQFDPDA